SSRPAVRSRLGPAVGVARPTVPVAAVSRVPGAWAMEPPVVFAPVFVATVIVPAEPAVMLWRAAPPVPPPAAFTLTRTAVAVALGVVMELPGLMVKSSAPAPLVLALMGMRLLPAPPTLAPRGTASPLARVIAPLPVDTGPVVSVPLVLVRLMAPAPVAVAVTVAPSVSVMNTPPVPEEAEMDPAVVRILVAAAPMPDAAPPV